MVGVLYPMNWLLLVLPPIAGINWQVLRLHPIAGIGAYAFARAIGCTRMAAPFGGLTFSLGGCLVAHLGQASTRQGAAYLWFARASNACGCGRAALCQRHKGDACFGW